MSDDDVKAAQQPGDIRPAASEPEAAGKKKGSLVRALRKELDWTKSELARRASLVERTITSLENGDNVTDITYRRVVKALNDGTREQSGQMSFPFVELEIADLFSFTPDNRGVALPAPSDADGMSKAIKVLMLKKAESKSA
jgi:DNA-binding XRE family transcriptional regulator